MDLDTTLLPAGGRLGGRTRCRRCCWRTASAAPRSRSAPTPRSFAGRGYAVLAWTARGFGRSGGQIHLDSPDYEVRDAQRLLDWLAAAPRDPHRRAPVTRGSAWSAARTAAALALLLAAAGPAGRRDRPDDHLERPVPRLPAGERAGGDATDGVFKKGWAGIFFGGGGNAGSGPAGLTGAPPPRRRGPESAGPPSPRRAPARAPVRCARVAPPTRPAAGSPPTSAPRTCGSPPPGRPTRRRWSCCDGPARPACWTGSRRRPCWSRARPTRSSRSPRRTPTPAASPPPARRSGSPGSPAATTAATARSNDSDRVKFLTAQWLDHYVKGDGRGPGDSFTCSRIAGFDALDRGLVATGFRTADYPGLAGRRPPRRCRSPARPSRSRTRPNGNPAAISSVPVRRRARLAAGRRRPATSPASTPASSRRRWPRRSTWSARRRSPCGPPRPTGEAVLFVKLYDVDPQGAADAAVRPGRPGAADRPAGRTSAPPRRSPSRCPRSCAASRPGTGCGSWWPPPTRRTPRPAEPAVYTVAPGDGPVTAAHRRPATPIPTAATVWRWVLAGLLAAIVVGLVVVVAARRAAGTAARTARCTRSTRASRWPCATCARSTPTASSPSRTWTSRCTPVRWSACSGPNGAGKTTTLRVLMGLTQPTAGEIYVFGHRLVPGSPVLSRIGALVEGPGFLPHLSGLENLKAYWRATGRPWEDAHFDEALEIAGLGDSVHRRIRNVQPRHAAAAGHRPGHARPARAAGARRADRRARPAADRRDAPGAPALRHRRPGGAGLQPPARRGGADLHPRGGGQQGRGSWRPARWTRSSASRRACSSTSTTRPRRARCSTGSTAYGCCRSADGGAGGRHRRHARSEVVAELVRAGIGVDRVVPRRRLEDAFLALVGENSRGSGDR